MDDYLAQVFGYENAEDYKNTTKEYERVRNKANEVYEKPPEKWPLIIFNWDYRLESQRFCFDGLKQCEFEKMYPEGLILGHMSLKEFDKYLCHFSRRDGDELWKVGCQSKLARMIVYLSEGNPITPPIIKPIQDNKVIFQGGHHRYAVAKAIELIEIPIYAYPEHVIILNQFMNISWVP